MADVQPIKHNWRFKDLTGQRFGRLVAVEFSHSQRKATMWRCLCDCATMVVVSYSNLVNSKQVSCGCKRVENGKAKRTHGSCRTPEYFSWQHAKSRCFNPDDIDFDEYGGRGITMSADWCDSFETFLADMGPRPLEGLQLDRIDNDGNYEKANCRWATMLQQANNRRPRRWKVRPKTNDQPE